MFVCVCANILERASRDTLNKPNDICYQLLCKMLSRLIVSWWYIIGSKPYIPTLYKTMVASTRLRWVIVWHVLYFSSVHVRPSWSSWRHQMETFSALLALWAGNSPVTGEFASQRPVTRSFDVFCDLCPNKRLVKQSWGWWFETPSRSLWRHYNVFHYW